MLFPNMQGNGAVDLKGFGQHLREAREQRGLSQGDLAMLVGKDQTAISEYENGRRKVTVTDLPLFAEVLGVSINYFFEGEITESDLDNILLREFHRLPSPETKQSAIEILRIFSEAVQPR